VYILASNRNGTLYVGVTSNLVGRTWQHREAITAGFSSKYHVHKLVWFEQHATAESAITREKQIKQWNRVWKMEDRVNRGMQPLLGRPVPGDCCLTPLPVERSTTLDSRLRGNDGVHLRGNDGVLPRARE